jgi:hydroxypyruvate isomerase
MQRLRFSANLGFLWNDRPLPDAIRAAHMAGFDAVELHWPYATPVADVRAALHDTGLPVLGLNTIRGNVAAGEMGLSALPGREPEAREAIDAAIDYAGAILCRNVHVMAGRADGEEARTTFVDNLAYAAEKARSAGIGLLVEPLNIHDAPGYFLNNCADAASIIADVGGDAVRIMFDCYHMGRMGRDILAEFRAHRDRIGHVQFAAVPDRAEPDHGDVDYATLLPELAKAGYGGFLGAEYKPRARVEEGLSWLRGFGVTGR